MGSWWVQLLAKGPGLTSIMAHEITRIAAAHWPRRVFESDSNNGPSQGHSSLGILKKITTACTIAALLTSLFFLPKCCEVSFKRAHENL